MALFKNKYRNKKVDIDGVKFDSIKESRRFLVLKEALNKHEIGPITVHQTFVLHAAFEKDGKKYRPITYEADFTYQQNGINVIEETKGFHTKDYMIKKKMMIKIIYDNCLYLTLS